MLNKKDQKKIIEYVKQHCNIPVQIKFCNPDVLIFNKKELQNHDMIVICDKKNEYGIIVDKTSVQYNAFYRALLLHEIGHVHTYRRRGRIKSEYDAHKWALEYTLDKRMKKEYNVLIEILQMWSKSVWHSKYRTYRIISSKLLKEYK